MPVVQTTISGAAVLLSAALLFSVQLIVGKLVLPLLGGSAAVWTTCMLFYQAVLLAGYAYAHALSARLAPPAQWGAHLVLLALSLLLVPVTLSAGLRPPAAGSPVPWLLGALVTSAGLPLFTLAATAPLVQHWFSRARHAAAAQPYVLYAASNLGSMIGLLGYPTVAEPLLTIPEQQRLWAGLYWVFAAACAGCGALALLTAARLPSDAGARPGEAATLTAPKVTWADRGRWLLLSLVPSSLLLGVTQYITTDLAPIPLLWVVPLALYLATFVLAFARRTPLWDRAAFRVQPILVGFVFLLWLWRIELDLPGIPLHLTAFFASAMVCHGALARLRPAPARLTEFYLWLALGGALGGVLNVVVAPLVFDRLLEYPAALVAALALRGAAGTDAAPRRSSHADLAVAVMPAAALVAAARWLGPVENAIEKDWMVAAAAVVIASSVAAAAWHRLAPRPLLLSVAVGIVAAAATRPEGSLIHTARSFYGAHQVRDEGGGAYHVLQHGTTTHGAQAVAAAARCDPLTYYSRGGPLGEALDGLPADGGRRVAAVGLGAGTVAAYARAGDEWTFYEIDPEIERTARDPRLFTYLRDCAPGVRVVLGDARLTLARAPAGGYDVIILDAFASDAIPVHLLTREAWALYRSRLSPAGALLVHVSNRYLDLAPVVAASAASAGMTGRIRSSEAVEEQRPWVLSSTWVVAARRAADLGRLAGDWRWERVAGDSATRPWTDDFSNVWGALRWR